MEDQDTDTEGQGGQGTSPPPHTHSSLGQASNHQPLLSGAQKCSSALHISPNTQGPSQVTSHPTGLHDPEDAPQKLVAIAQ